MAVEFKYQENTALGILERKLIVMEFYAESSKSALEQLLKYKHIIEKQGTFQKVVEDVKRSQEIILQLIKKLV